MSPMVLMFGCVAFVAAVLFSQATHRDRPEGYDGRRGEVSPREQAPPRGEDSALDQILKRFK